MSVRENVTLPALARYARFGWVSRAVESDAVTVDELKCSRCSKCISTGSFPDDAHSFAGPPSPAGKGKRGAAGG